MQDRLKQGQERVMMFWNKYSSKQKTVIICVTAAIFFAFVLLVYFMSRATYIHLYETKDTEVANAMLGELESNGMDIKKSIQGDTIIIDVNQDNYTDAALLIGGSDKFSNDMTWDEALKNDMSTTSSEKQQKSVLALSSSLRLGLLQFDGVKDVSIYIDRPKDDYTVYSESRETSVGISLTLEENVEFTGEIANAMANLVKNAVGNKTTDSITITTTNGDLLFSGETANSLGGQISTNTEFKEKLRNQFAENVKRLLLKSNYDDVQVSSNNIQFNMDKVDTLFEEYSVAEGNDQGYLSSSYDYSSKGNSGSGGIPGTDTNDDVPDYTVENGGTSESETTLTKNEYALNKLTKTTEYEKGAVLPEQSSIGIVLTSVTPIREETLEKEGLLANTTFEEYVAANSKKTVAEVPQEIYDLVAGSTGLVADKSIKIVAYNQNTFIPKEKSAGTNISNILMIVLAVLIIGLIIFVVFRSTAPVEVTEMEPELSVEQLLATTKESQSLDDIEFSEKSETRRMIEKFVDENPDAVAQLLRNWLNEDWG